MSGGVQQSLFFLRLPDLNKLVCVTLSLRDEDEEPRSKQMKTCRELVLLYSDILASPALDSFTEITVVMAISFFQKGIVQVFAQKRCLQLGSPQCVLPGVLQCCLSYSLIARLAPSWNKAGLYLISGKDFLTDTGRMNAVSLELSTSEGQLCFCVDANTVRFPPTTLDDFNLPPLVLRRFCTDPDSILDPTSTGGAIWCHVLPSMKKGQIITLSRQLPRDGPFRTYRDLQNHWNHLYGYRLPELAEEEVVYCSVYFRLVGDRLFTYPLSCIRLQPVQRCPRVDLQGALGSFLSDIRARLQSVCGFPACLTSKPCYHTVSLNTAAAVQEMSRDQANLTTSSSTRLVLTQFPAPPPQIEKSVSGSQPPAWTPGSQQDQAQRLSHSQEGTGNRTLSSSTSSSHVSYALGYHSAPSHSILQPASSVSSSISSCSLPLFQPASSLTSSISSCSLPLFQPSFSLTSSTSSSSVPLFQPASSLTSSISSSISSSSVSLFQPASSLTSSISSCSLPLFQPASSLTSYISSSSVPLFQPASSLTSSTSSSSVPLFQPASSLNSSISSSSVLSPIPLLSQVPVNPTAKLVPIFKNKHPSRHVNVAVLRVQKQQQRGGVEEKGRVIPTFGKNKPTFAPTSSSSSSLPVCTPPTTVHFNTSPKCHGITAPPYPKPKHIFSLSPASKCEPGLILTLQPEVKLKPKSILKNSSDRNTVQGKTIKHEAPCLPYSNISSKDTSCSSGEKVIHEEKKKGKKHRAAIRDVDVEKMARSNQLSKLNSATLLVWLKGRGVLVGAKHKKEELMLKVMSCLAEA